LTSFCPLPRIGIALEGAVDPLGAFPLVPAELRIRLLKVQHASGGSGGGGGGSGGQKLFSPSLGQQRYEMVRGIVLDVVAAAAAAARGPPVIVDIGEGASQILWGCERTNHARGRNAMHSLEVSAGSHAVVCVQALCFSGK
jgi:hypothetical protein